MGWCEGEHLTLAGINDCPKELSGMKDQMKKCVRATELNSTGQARKERQQDWRVEHMKGSIEERVSGVNLDPKDDQPEGSSRMSASSCPSSITCQCVAFDEELPRSSQATWTSTTTGVMLSMVTVGKKMRGWRRRFQLRSGILFALVPL